MSYRVLIPTAGIGARLAEATRYINKSLVSVANRPMLSHLIELFPKDAEFVIALGYKGNLVQEFLEIAYPERQFYFAQVNPFEGPGSGLGLSVLFCKKYLQEPFVFISCDTLVREPIPHLDQDWMGYAELPDPNQYRTLKIEAGKIVDILEKNQADDQAVCKPYIGLAGIRNYQRFWQAMEKGDGEAIAQGESYGLRNLLSQEVKACRFTWYDTGNPDALVKTREVYRQPDSPNILEKANEAIWFVGKQVIKFSNDEHFIANRVSRAQELSGFVPEVTDFKPHMYRYLKAEGRVLSEIVTLPLFNQFLEYSRLFWQPYDLSLSEQQKFLQACMNFYRDKTKGRVELFYKNFDKSDGMQSINGLSVPELKDLLGALDWNWLAQGLAGRFHGDFHFENIIFSPGLKRFTFLDWRQDFGGSLKIGDIYYDLAKLLHGLIICHELIAQERYWIQWKADEISFEFDRKQVLVECEKYYFDWLAANGYDKKKVRILTALIYLNIAALHHYPYSLLLFSLGKHILYQELKGQNGIN